VEIVQKKKLRNIICINFVEENSIFHYLEVFPLEREDMPYILAFANFLVVFFD